MNCWITEKGKVIKVPVSGHNKFAEKYLTENTSISILDLLKSENVDYPYQVLHKKGWVRVCSCGSDYLFIGGDTIDCTKPMRNTMDPPMNAIQMKAAKKIANDLGTTFHKAINDKRFW
jgi:hypothetical protein